MLIYAKKKRDVRKSYRVINVNSHSVLRNFANITPA